MKALVEQAFVNIVQNAYDAMSSGGGELRVRVRNSVSGSRNGIEVRIEDSGPRHSARLARTDFQSVCDHEEKPA